MGSFENLTIVSLSQTNGSKTQMIEFCMYDVIDWGMEKCFKIQLKDVQARNTCEEIIQILSLDEEYSM